jgi:hypothetical protein
MREPAVADVLKAIRLSVPVGDGCSQTGAPDPARYYDVLRLYYARTRSSEWATAFPDQPLTVGTEIGPALKLLASMEIACPKVARKIQSLAADLANLQDSDRIYSAVMLYGDIGTGLTAFADRCRQCRIDPQPPLQALRDYVVRHAMAERCRDGYDIRVQRQTEREVIESINRQLKQFRIAPITARNQVPANLVGGRVPPWDFNSLDERRALSDIHELQYKVGRIPLSAEQKHTAQWRRQFRDTAIVIGGWSGSSMLHSKLTLLTSLLVLSPDQEAVRLVLPVIVETLKGASLVMSPAALVYRLTLLAKICHTLKVTDEFRALCSNSGSALLITYIQFGEELLLPDAMK